MPTRDSFSPSHYPPRRPSGSLFPAVVLLIAAVFLAQAIPDGVRLEGTGNVSADNSSQVVSGACQFNLAVKKSRCDVTCHGSSCDLQTKAIWLRPMSGIAMWSQPRSSLVELEIRLQI